MRLLILGGTEFVGRAVTEAALARGWDVTCFHRGRHEAPAGARVLHGDRTEPRSLAALDGGEWDAVVDTWSSAPTAVRDAARVLKDRVNRYVYVSSCSVYDWPPLADYNEDTPLVDGSADADHTAYAEDKRGGELAALREFGAERTLFVRCGLIIGPWENIGRLPYWLNRIARGGAVLAPGPYELPVQYIDVRDLAEWTLDATEKGLGGPYNMVGPQGSTTIGELLDTCVRVTGSSAELRWTDPGTLLDAGVEPWTQLPIWMPPDTELHDAAFRADVTAALESGLRVRPVAETVADTWQWLTSIGGEAPQRPDRPRVGLTPEREREVLGL
ncbi:NAD-dependent epimerase/dehydratase family protein [Streptomyces sp. NA04227]|uniref:NAD-dependent epimerase/dehydratase family protein n=1 Tax=Streptomyces sp. NA04227 TaxID=2742136 RepID=UPI0015905ADB|nr:NAD-dependent epimerase/dehydratase family protein [Streptomyces sp. NA04227]QKW06116.1 NAD-dependent epimerase/dehydratase family protein [Streptomyces sp. NA04227]